MSFTNKRFHVSGRAIFLAVVVVVCLLPLIWTVMASLQIWPVAVIAPVRWVFEPSLDRYLEVGVAEPNFGIELLTSAFVAALTTLITTTVAFFAAYAIARSHFRGRNILIQSFLVLASLPVISYLIPLSNVIDALHLENNVIGISLAEAGLYAPLAVYVLFGYFNHLSAEHEEAAFLEGASIWYTLRKIVLPVCLSGVAATAIIVYVLSWNQVLIPLVLGPRLHMIPIAMIDFFNFERELEWPTAAAALITSLVPIGLFVAAAHRVLEQFNLSGTSQS